MAIIPFILSNNDVNEINSLSQRVEECLYKNLIFRPNFYSGEFDKHYFIELFLSGYFLKVPRSSNSVHLIYAQLHVNDMCTIFRGS